MLRLFLCRAAGLVAGGLLVWGGSARAQGEAIVWRDGIMVHPTRALVQWKAGVVPRTRTGTVASLPGGRVARTFAHLPGWAVVELDEAPTPRRRTAVPPRRTLQNRLQRLRRTGQFAIVEPDFLVRTAAAPTDQAFLDGTLWGLRNTGRAGGVAGADINASAAWAVTTGDRRVVVAVIDTGLRLTHQDLAANLWRNPREIPGNGLDDDGNGYVDDVHGINTFDRAAAPMDDHGHGSHVAGTIAALGNGGGPHVGVAWEASLMALKFLNEEGAGYVSGAIQCIDYAIAQRVDIINASWGGSGQSASLEAAIRRAAQAGILFVAAAGNAGRDLDVRAFYPAAYPIENIISVAALDHRDQLAWFSNYGPGSVHLGAPGAGIFSCTAESDVSYATYNGTSMAAPHVAGVAALLAARFPGLGATAMRQRILQGTTPIAALAGQTWTGGRLNAAAALDITQDGNLRLSARADQSPLRAGLPARFYVSVNDLLPVTGATVTGRLGGGPETVFLDNGVWPDLVANDGTYAAQLTAPVGAATARLEVSAAAAGKSPGAAAFVFPVANRPGNDDFLSRWPTGGGVTRSFGSNRNATLEAGEPRHPATAGGATVWWSWTAPADQVATISTAGSDYDTTLAVYRGTDLASLELLAENDDSGGVTSAVTFEAEAGVAYSIQVDGFRGASGLVVLNHPVSLGSVGSPPVILEEPANRTVLVGRPLVLTVRAAGATAYQWLRDGSPLTGQTAPELRREPASEADSGLYQVRVANASGTVTSREAIVVVQRTALRPDNDDFSAAFPLPEHHGRAESNNELATAEPGEPDHAGVSRPQSSVWFRWTAPGDGRLTLHTEGSNFDTVLAVYRGNSVDGLTEVASNDNASGLQSRLSLAAAAQVTYWIAVDGRGSSRGDIVLHHEFSSGNQGAKTNDFFARRTRFEGPVATGSNIGATGEEGEPDHAGVSLPLASVWWEWTAPADGTMRFNTLGSNYDTTLAVYEGTEVDQLRRVASNDDLFGRLSAVSFQARAGTSYAIAVDGKEDSQGDIRLNGRFVPDAPPPVQAPPRDVRALKPPPVRLPVTATGAWQATSDVPWLRVSPPRGTGAARLIVKMDSNTGSEAREGRLLVAGVQYLFRQAGRPLAAAAAGSYHGVVGRLGAVPSTGEQSLTDDIEEISGALVLTLTAKGRYTAQLRSGPTTFRGGGRMHADGSVKGTWSGAGRRVDVDLQIHPRGPVYWSGQIQPPGGSAATVAAGRRPARQPGTGTRRAAFILPAAEDGTPATSPGGSGWAHARLNDRWLRLAGRLPGGAPFSASLALWRDTGQNGETVVLAFVPAADGHGYLAGWLQGRARGSREDWRGVWRWTLPRGQNPARYPAGIDAGYDAMLVPYVIPPVGGRPFGWNQSVLQLAGGSEVVTEYRDGRLRFPGISWPCQVSWDRGTGVFRGRVQPPGQTSPWTVSGIVDQSSGRVYGSIERPGGGVFTLRPR